MKLTDEEMEDKTDKGTRCFATKVSYVGTDLKKEGIMESSNNGIWKLSDKGREATVQELCEIFNISEMIAKWL